ncbi:universal stress protein [Oryzifoliimicrobium ureilyticus]|uniref:universal stress protein n=1 Tax=Oryzifoliimicrobium ureilyticus TaxID=3113724 RepID=UPI0030765F7C
MSYKTLLAVLDTVEKTAKTADFAFDLARQHDAHVIGLHAETVSAVPIAAPMNIPDPIALEALQSVAHDQAEKIEAAFQTEAGKVESSSEWRNYPTSTGYNALPVIEAARSADLLIVSQTNPETSLDMGIDVDNLLYEIGRPLLVIPFVLQNPKPIRRVLVAWNGSREAARAVFDSLPFLKKAEEVEIFMVDSNEHHVQNATLSGADIAATLRRHGVQARLSSKASGDQSTSAIIESRLADGSIDLLVMGAYTHSWLWQTLFGGTTKNLLKSMTALTLLSR